MLNSFGCDLKGVNSNPFSIIQVSKSSIIVNLNCDFGGCEIPNKMAELHTLMHGRIDAVFGNKFLFDQDEKITLMIAENAFKHGCDYNCVYFKKIFNLFNEIAK